MLCSISRCSPVSWHNGLWVGKPTLRNSSNFCESTVYLYPPSPWKPMSTTFTSSGTWNGTCTTLIYMSKIQSTNTNNSTSKSSTSVKTTTISKLFQINRPRLFIWKRFLSKLADILFIGCEFWKSSYWIVRSYYILYACKISKKSKLNSYIIKWMFKFQVFAI